MGREYFERQDVLAFNAKFRVPMAEQPSLLCKHLREYRVKFLAEELIEFKDAMEREHLPDAADALVDLAYVLHGTALMMGLPWSQLWELVHEKNMAKTPAKRAEESKRGSIYDVVKPPEWTPPDHRTYLGDGPWPVFDPEV